MQTTSKSLVTAALWAASVQGCLAQLGPVTILAVELENRVQYYGDSSEVSKFATDVNVTSPTPSRNFVQIVIIADIVAINGQAAKGTSVFHIRQINLRTAPNAGEAIADVVRNNVVDIRFEILKSDGIPVGTIMASGLGGGVGPPGAPSAVRVGNVAIVGGTGAFLGARGQVGQGETLVSDRNASMIEDPANRRRNGGGRVRYVLHVIPLFRPEITIASSSPGIYHSDFSQVSDTKPARPGEILIIRATGLGPVRPGVDPDEPFPFDVLREVNSPIDVIVNGKAADVFNKIGWPGTSDTYRVDFRLPEETRPGPALIKVTSAWISGSGVRIPVQ